MFIMLQYQVQLLFAEVGRLPAADKVNKYTIQGNMREEVAAREVNPKYPRCFQCQLQFRT